MFDYIVVDTAPAFDEQTLTTLEDADECVIIATLDVPICSGLEALLSECPVLSDAVTAILDRRTSAIDPAAFQFISSPAQVRQVRTFASMLHSLLTRA